MQLKSTRILLTLAGVLVLVLAGLNSCSDNSIQPGPAQLDGSTGYLRVYLVDAPAVYEDLEALNIVFREVKVHAGDDEGAEEDDEDGGWITVMSDTLPETERTFDLLELVGGVSALMGEVELEADHYTQLRIVIESATVTIAGETSPVKVPSGPQSGLKLIGGWDVDPGVITSLTLDFDASKSLHEAPPGSGNFMLKPTIRLVQTVVSGTISGTVTPMGIGAVVSAYDSVADTVVTSAYADTAGVYMLQALLAGTYDVEATAAGYDSVRVEDVEVQAGQNTGDVDFTLTPID